MTLANLKKGESAIISEIEETPIIHKLMDMGCLPGERVTLKYKAPLGDPLCIQIAGYELILRTEEARSIRVQI
jgi:ferrous iron transport protein A